MRSRFAFIWVLLTAAIAGVAAWIAYGVGVATHVASSVPATAEGVAPYYYGYPGFGFFPFFGFFWFLFILFVIFLVLRAGRGWGHRRFGGWGGPGGPGGPGGMPPGIEERLKSWHESAHGEDKTAQK
jgi:hypothetical protein